AGRLATAGGLFSVALSVASPRLAVGEHAARGSSDFPPHAAPSPRRRCSVRRPLRALRPVRMITISVVALFPAAPEPGLPVLDVDRRIGRAAHRVDDLARAAPGARE